MQKLQVWKQPAAMEDPSHTSYPRLTRKSSSKAKLRSSADKENFYSQPVWTAQLSLGTLRHYVIPPKYSRDIFAPWAASGLAPQVVPTTCGLSFLQPGSVVHAEQPLGTSTQHFFPSLQHGLAVARGASTVLIKGLWKQGFSHPAVLSPHRIQDTLWQFKFLLPLELYCHL